MVITVRTRMPTYEYRCAACEHELEAFQKMTDAKLSKCPACGKNQLERLISGGAFHLKGDGWYKDLYASSSKSKSKEKE